MNDWPADPKLDASLRQLVDYELAEARLELIDPPMHRVAPRSRGLVSWASVGIVAVAALVAAVALRGSFGGVATGPGAAREPTPMPSPSADSSPTAASSGAPSASGTPGPSPTAGPTASANFHPTGTPVTADIMSATRLADGRVLLIGTDSKSPQIYDPKTGKFVRTGDLPVVAEGATATLLSDGRVLIAGGHTTRTVAAAELYDPATGTFSPTGPMTEPREYHTATLLADGRVLIAGGESVTYAVTTNAEADLRPGASGGGPRGNAYGPPGTDTAELYDPKTGAFSATGSMTIAREGASAARLADGRVLVSGGDVNVGSPNQATVPPIPDHATADIYDPTTAKFSAAGTLRTWLSGSSAILLHDGRVLIAGGNVEIGHTNSIDVYDPATGKFSVPSSAGSKLFYHSVALLADGRVLLVGGAAIDTTLGGPTDTSTCDLYDPASGKVSPAGTSAGGGENALATTLLDGRVLITGTTSGAPAELYVP